MDLSSTVPESVDQFFIWEMFNFKRDLKNFAKKTKKNENFQQSHSAEKSERRDPLGFFNIRSVAKYQKK